MNPRFLCPGNWAPGQVSADWVTNSRRLVPEVESAIDTAWATALARPGVHLFDGPMCRMESWQATSDRLRLLLSTSSYKPFLGTNMSHPEFVDQYGTEVMANPVGVSPALLTADGYLLFGIRNTSVAYYPGRIHPFAGCMEPGDTDVFTAVAPELHEELSLAQPDLADIRCTGIAEDTSLRQPELIFAAESLLNRAQIESRLEQTEHGAAWSIPANASTIAAAVVEEKQLTPVAIAAMLLWGRLRFGEAWFAERIA